jgi:hypothetical protein
VLKKWDSAPRPLALSTSHFALRYALRFPLTTFMPCWLTPTLIPATVTLELRALPVFCTAATCAAPLSVPVPVADTHDVLDEEAHEHPLVVVTVNVVEPPDTEKVTELGETE